MVLLKTHFRGDIREIFEFLNLKSEYLCENVIFFSKHHFGLLIRGLIHENNYKKSRDTPILNYVYCTVMCVYKYPNTNP